MTEPPQLMIQMAEMQGRFSPCHKSKRGAVAFYPAHGNPDGETIVGIGYNGPPSGYSCDGSEACRKFCGKRCIHAEIRALRMTQMLSPKLMAGVHLVHVKIGMLGRVVAGGPPSCVDCSKEILDIGIGTIWLYEADGDIKLDAAGDIALSPAPTTLDAVLEQRAGKWRSYTAALFHELSRKNAKGGEVY